MSELIISVSGVRGIVGESLTPQVACDFAAALGAWAAAAAGRTSPLVCVARDGRPSGPEILAAAVKGLRLAGCRVIDLGLAATPTASVMVGHLGADAGLVVTASHNPPEYNGLKVLASDGSAPPQDQVREIARRFRQGVQAATTHAGPPRADATGPGIHVRRVLAAVDPAAIGARRFRVVLDSCGGAGGAAGRPLLAALECTVVHMYGDPSGCCAHGLEPTEQNLRELARRTVAEHADVGFAQDPDADRLAIVDERGRYVGEEYTLALCARCVLKRRGAGTIVTNLSTSRLVDEVAAACPGAGVLRTAVGEANVAAAIKEHGAVLGGEGNGGVIDPAVCLVRDSHAAMALILWLMASAGRPVSDLVDDLPGYAMVKRRLDLDTIGGRASVASMLGRVAAAFPTLPVNMADGVRVDFEDGWAHLRASNTEPIARLIAEARTPARAADLADRLAAAAGL
jgi:phosphomannomutase